MGLAIIVQQQLQTAGAMHSVRKAVASDAEGIVELANKNSFKIGPDGNLSGELIPLKLQGVLATIGSSGFYVAMVGDDIVGCDSVAEYLDTIEMRSLAVAEAYRGNGIASSLVQACASETAQRGYRELFTLTKPGNIPVFEKFGFVIASQVPAAKYQKECSGCIYLENKLCVEVPMVMKL